MPALRTLYGDQPVSHELVKGVTRIGRALESEIRIALKVVSKLHATVTYSDSGCLLENFSSNQTYLNGGKITAATKLNHGDKIRVATVTLMFIDKGLEDSSGIMSGREPVRTIVSDGHSDCDDPDASLRRTAIPLSLPTRKVTISHHCDISSQKIRSSVLLNEQSITSLLTGDAAKAISQMLRLIRVVEVAEGVDRGDLVAENLKQYFPTADEIVILSCNGGDSVDLVVWGASGLQGRSVIVCADVVRRVAKQLECLLISDLWRDSHEVNPALSKMGCVSLLCVPVRAADGSCRGVVQMLSTKPSPDFEADDLGRLAILAQLLTMVIQPATSGEGFAC